MRHARLLTDDGHELARVEMAETARERARGLLGRSSLPQGQSMWLAPCRSIHTIGMRFAIDVAFCDTEGVVVKTVQLAPWRLSPYVHRSAFVIEAQSGAFDRWRLRAGDRVELRA